MVFFAVRTLKKCCLSRMSGNLGIPESRYHTACEKPLSRPIKIRSWTSFPKITHLKSSGRKTYSAAICVSIRPLLCEHVVRSNKVCTHASFQRMTSCIAPSIGDFWNIFFGLKKKEFWFSKGNVNSNSASGIKSFSAIVTILIIQFKNLK